MISAAEDLKRIRKEKKTNKSGGLTYVLRDLEKAFSDGLLQEVTELYMLGHQPEEIGEVLDRNPDEVFIALFHQARQGKADRAFAKRLRR